MGIKISRVNLWGIGAGIIYGLCMRLIFGEEGASKSIGIYTVFTVMSIGFIFFVPLALGILTVRFALRPSWVYSIFGPWISVALFIAASIMFKWEGFICGIMAAPIFLVMGSIGGIIMKVILMLNGSKRAYIFTGFLFLPFISSGIESQFVVPPTQRLVPTQIIINAPVDVVWNNIIRIPKIQPKEHHLSFFQSMGFPKPIEATLSREGVGGVRHATFEGGLLFIETITEWQEKKKLVFSIKANTESIPPTTLDQHVKIGGEYFDMLEGDYEIEPIGSNKVILHLSSTQRLSTRFNAYAGLWTEAVMRSIQNYILVIIKQRCEGKGSK